MKQFLQRIAQRIALVLFVVLLIITNIISGVSLAVKFGELNSSNQQIKELQDKVQSQLEDIDALKKTQEQKDKYIDSSKWKTYTSDKLKLRFKYPEVNFGIKIRSQSAQLSRDIVEITEDMRLFESNSNMGLIEITNNLDGFTKLTIEKVEGLESIEINGKNYKFEYYGQYEGAPCYLGGFTYAVIELSKTQYVGIYSTLATTKCNNASNILNESDWTTVSTPTQQNLEIAKTILKSITLL